jgi:hypothetical protein
LDDVNNRRRIVDFREGILSYYAAMTAVPPANGNANQHVMTTAGISSTATVASIAVTSPTAHGIGPAAAGGSIRPPVVVIGGNRNGICALPLANSLTVHRHSSDSTVGISSSSSTSAVSMEDAQQHLLASLVEANTIYSHYIDNGAPNELNLSQTMRLQVRATIDNVAIRAATANNHYIQQPRHSPAHISHLNTSNTLTAPTSNNTTENTLIGAPDIPHSPGGGGAGSGGGTTTTPASVTPSFVPRMASLPVRLITRQGVSVSSLLSVEEAAMLELDLRDAFTDCQNLIAALLDINAFARFRASDLFQQLIMAGWFWRLSGMSSADDRQIRAPAAHPNANAVHPLPYALAGHDNKHAHTTIEVRTDMEERAAFAGGRHPGTTNGGGPTGTNNHHLPPPMVVHHPSFSPGEAPPSPLVFGAPGTGPASRLAAPMSVLSVGGGTYNGTRDGRAGGLAAPSMSGAGSTTGLGFGGAKMTGHRLFQVGSYHSSIAAGGPGGSPVGSVGGSGADGASPIASQRHLSTISGVSAPPNLNPNNNSSNTMGMVSSVGSLIPSPSLDSVHTRASPSPAVRSWSKQRLAPQQSTASLTGIGTDLTLGSIRDVNLLSVANNGIIELTGAAPPASIGTTSIGGTIVSISPISTGTTTLASPKLTITSPPSPPFNMGPTTTITTTPTATMNVNRTVTMPLRSSSTESKSPAATPPSRKRALAVAVAANVSAIINNTTTNSIDKLDNNSILTP